jgi:hypothetical protein
MRGGRVKRGKSQSLGLHGNGVRKGAAHMTWAACRGGGGASAGSGWTREGEKDPRPVGQLGRLAAWRVG